MGNTRKRADGLERLPLVPLRGELTYPSMMIRLDLGRSKSIQALSRALESNGPMMLVAQRDAHKEDPHIEDVYGVGTIVSVRQTVLMPDDTMRVLVEGESRALLVDVQERGDVQYALVKRFATKVPDDELLLAAHLRMLRDRARDFMRLRDMYSPELSASIEGSEDAGELADTVAQELLQSVRDKQQILECSDVIERVEQVCKIIARDTQILEIEGRIQENVRVAIDKHQRDYYLTEQIKAIRAELGDDEGQERDQLERQLNESKMNAVALAKAQAEFKRLSHIPPGSPEHGVSRNYIDYLLDLPWGVTCASGLDLARARSVLQADHYGLDKVKQRILEYLAICSLKDNMHGPILCLVGPPGVGKTSIAQSIARALDRKFVRMSLGGLRDEAEIRGHRRTYIGAVPGRVIASIKQAGAMDPVFLLDEIDKMASDYRGDPASAMLEVLDPEQNATFTDHYLEAPFDLSRVLFITTANTTDAIPPALLDRMEIIPIPGYTLQEKAEIARRHLWPKQLAAHGLSAAQLRISKAAIMEVIEGYTREAGVRSLERELGTLIRKAAIRYLETPEPERALISLGVKQIQESLGPRRHTRTALEKRPEAGLVNGLAWTAVGGDTLCIEAICMPGSGKLDLTGQLGSVMQESARAALSYIRSRSAALNIPEDFYQHNDLHIHVPEGSTPKDGPSAGVALTCAMVSAITNRPARQDVAMTGEVTLRGRVLLVGGVKEKLLAAHRMGIKEVLLPVENEKDLLDLPENVRNALQVKLIGSVEQALETVFMV